MNKKALKRISFATVCATSLAVSIGVTLKIAIIPIIAFPVGLLISFLIRRNKADKIKDERLIHLAEKAARISFYVCVIAQALLGTFLVAYDNSNGTLYSVGMALNLSGLFLLMLHSGVFLVLTKNQ
jgi:uncharacterized membrane protein